MSLHRISISLCFFSVYYGLNLLLALIGMAIYLITFLLIKGISRDEIYLLAKLLTDTSQTT